MILIKLNDCVVVVFFLPSSEQLGSIPTLPARSCKEIKANEGGQAVSGNSWLDATGSGEVILGYCDMNTEGLIICHFIFKIFLSETFLYVFYGYIKLFLFLCSVTKVLQPLKDD